MLRHVRRLTTKTTHFGFKTVPSEEKESLVREVFASVAPSYDRMNDFMSMGIHRLWKDNLISKLDPTGETRLLDVAGGTGDIAFRFVEKTGMAENVTVVDINTEMLAYGRQRAVAKNLNMDFVEGNAQDLQLESNSYDAYTIAFGIRNCTDIPKVLEEAYRVLKPGGRFLCLEFSHVRNPVLAQLYNLHSFHVIPKLGELVANDRESYQYLVESIRKFPLQEDFAEMIRKAGFKTFGEGYENLTFGVAAIHSGFKI